MTGQSSKKTGEGRVRSAESRVASPAKPQSTLHSEAPAAGAHAADHLINEEATPGAGALPSSAHRAGREVDGGAG